MHPAEESVLALTWSKPIRECHAIHCMAYGASKRSEAIAQSAGIAPSTHDLSRAKANARLWRSEGLG